MAGIRNFFQVPVGEYSYMKVLKIRLNRIRVNSKLFLVLKVKYMEELEIFRSTISAKGRGSEFGQLKMFLNPIHESSNFLLEIQVPGRE